MENWFVVVMGLCTVFVVLILIIVLCWLLGLVCKALGKKETAEAPKAAPALDDASIPNRPHRGSQRHRRICASHSLYQKTLIHF